MAKGNGISRASVCRLMKEAGNTPQVKIISAQRNCRPSEQQAVFEAA